jgi:hypothetical protein
MKKKEDKLVHLLEIIYTYALEMDKDITNEFLNPTISSYEESDNLNFNFEEKPKLAFGFILRLKECLSLEVIGKHVHKIVEKLFKLTEEDWRYKYLGLITIYEFANFYVDDLNDIDIYLPYVYSNLNSNNNKIKFAALCCIKVFNLRFSYEFKKKEHKNFMENILNMLINNKDNSNTLRNSIEIINVLSSFLDNCPKNALPIYEKFVIENLSDYFLFIESNNNTSNLLRRKLLKLFSVIVDTFKNNFTIYAEKILNFLMELFNKFYISKSNYEIYGDFLECITLIGPYAKNLYLTSLDNIINLVLEIQNNIPLDTDPIRNNLEKVYKNLLGLLKNNMEIKKYLPDVVKSILMLVKNLPKISDDKFSKIQNHNIIENLLSEKEEDENMNNLIDIQTSETEDITSAIRLLKSAVKSLNEEFLPYIEITQNEIFELINYKINNNIRNESTKILHHLVNIIAKTSSKEVTSSFTKLYLSKLMESIESEYNNSALLTKINHMGKIVKTSEYFLNKEELFSFFRKLTTLIDEIEERRLKLIENHKNLLQRKQKEKSNNKNNTNLNNNNNNNDEDEIFEEEDMLDPEKMLEEDIEEIEDIQTFISDVIGIAFKTHKNISQDVIKSINFEWLPKYLKTNASNFDIMMGILIVDDMIEFLGQDFLGDDIWTNLSFILIKYCIDSDCKIRRAANYGIGIIAKETIRNFNLIAENIINSLQGSFGVQLKGKNEHNWGAAKDNATAALGKILKYQTSSIDLNGAYNLWLHNMPIIYDETEMEEQNEILCKIIIERSEFALGDNMKYVDIIIRIFAKIFGTEKYSNEKIDEYIRQITKIWKNNTKLMTLVKNTTLSCEPKFQKKIKKLFEN